MNTRLGGHLKIDITNALIKIIYARKERDLPVTEDFLVALRMSLPKRKMNVFLSCFNDELGPVLDIEEIALLKCLKPVGPIIPLEKVLKTISESLGLNQEEKGELCRIPSLRKKIVLG